MRTEHYRPIEKGGHKGMLRQLLNWNEDLHFSPEFQEIRFLPEPDHILQVKVF